MRIYGVLMRALALRVRFVLLLECGEAVTI